jgi:hypothetical protein
MRKTLGLDPALYSINIPYSQQQYVYFDNSSSSMGVITILVLKVLSIEIDLAARGVIR